MPKLSRTAAAIVIFCGVLSTSVIAQKEQPGPPQNFTFWSPEHGNWVEDPDAPGTFDKNVSGNPRTGNWVMFVKVNPGASINWHWHTHSQMIYGVSGTMTYEVKPHQPLKLLAGSYLVIPGRALHNGSCISKEPCTFFIENPRPNDKHMTDAEGREKPTGKR
jgi:quercetin dioxygenase-like cupin family protein